MSVEALREVGWIVSTGTSNGGSWCQIRDGYFRVHSEYADTVEQAVTQCAQWAETVESPNLAALAEGKAKP